MILSWRKQDGGWNGWDDRIGMVPYRITKSWWFTAGYVAKRQICSWTSFQNHKQKTRHETLEAAQEWAELDWIDLTAEWKSEAHERQFGVR